MARIIVRLKGGLGNQMFMYAASKSLALANNYELVIDHLSGFVNDYKFNRSYELNSFDIKDRLIDPSEVLITVGPLKRHIRKFANIFKPYSKYSYITERSLSYNPLVFNQPLIKDCYVDGYWQSFKYFDRYDDIIRKAFTFRVQEDPIVLKYAEDMINSNSVSLHFRNFEQVNPNESANINYDYYVHAIKIMERTYPDSKFFIFTDSPEYAKSKIPLDSDRFIMVEHGNPNPATDMWLMTQCKNFIIANSTFSWWGAWLAVSNNKTVIAPSLKKLSGDGAWGFDGLLPKDWILV